MVAKPSAFLIWTFLAGNRVMATIQHLAREGMDTIHPHQHLRLTVAAAMELAAMEAAAEVEVEVHTVPCPTQALANLMAVAITMQAATPSTTPVTRDKVTRIML